MTEVASGSHEVHLREAYKEPAGPTPAELAAEAEAKLAASIRRLHPEYTDKQIKTFIKGK